MIVVKSELQLSYDEVDLLVAKEVGFILLYICIVPNDIDEIFKFKCLIRRGFINIDLKGKCCHTHLKVENNLSFSSCCIRIMFLSISL